jgi:hypothetical protein
VEEEEEEEEEEEGDFFDFLLFFFLAAREDMAGVCPWRGGGDLVVQYLSTSQFISGGPPKTLFSAGGTMPFGEDSVGYRLTLYTSSLTHYHQPSAKFT